MNELNTKDKGNRPLVLTVDDNPTITQLVAVYLQKFNYRIVSAKDGEEGLAAAKEFLPDVILLDIQMPKMDGWTLIRHLRVLPEFSFTPIIFLTDLNAGPDRRKGFRLGADDFMSKELICDELDIRIEKAITSARLYKDNARRQMKSIEFGNETFSGDLEEIGLAPMILLCQEEEITGLMMMNNTEGETGLIYLIKGDVASVKQVGSGIVKNEEAFASLLKWTKGSFTLERLTAIPTDKEIRIPTEALLAVAASRMEDIA